MPAADEAALAGKYASACLQLELQHGAGDANNAHNLPAEETLHKM